MNLTCASNLVRLFTSPTCPKSAPLHVPFSKISDSHACISNPVYFRHPSARSEWKTPLTDCARCGSHASFSLSLSLCSRKCQSVRNSTHYARFRQKDVNRLFKKPCKHGISTPGFKVRPPRHDVNHFLVIAHQIALRLKFPRR